MPLEALSWRRALHFAPDASLDPTWFRSYEASRYGGENSLDLESIDRPNASYDFISLNSVLEFIPDDRGAFRELLRIGSTDCIVQCTFAPFGRASHHFDEPHGPFGRYHVYGQDVSEWLGASLHDLTTLTIAARDPATSIREHIHFFCRQPRDAALFDIFDDSE